MILREYFLRLHILISGVGDHSMQSIPQGFPLQFLFIHLYMDFAIHCEELPVAIVAEGDWKNTYYCKKCNVKFKRKRTYAKVLTGVGKAAAVVGTIMIGGDITDAF